MNRFEFDVNEYMYSFRRRFKGGGGGEAPSSQIAETANAKWAKSATFPLVANAIEGGGFGTSQFNNRRDNLTRTGLDDSFKQTKSEVNSQMYRSLRPEDSRVQNFVGASLDRAYVTAQDQAERGMRAEKVTDQSNGMDMAGTMLANETRLGVSGQQSFNNALSTSMSNAQNMGTFGTNIASGAGQSIGDYMASQDPAAMYARKMGAS